MKAVVKVDVHVKEAKGHSAEEMARAVRVEFSSGESVRVATPEDTVVRKLWWYRKGDEASDRQWRDVGGVLKMAHSELDRSYMQHWASVLGVEDLLGQALEEVRGGPRKS